jgi:hypothetical protein
LCCAMGEGRIFFQGFFDDFIVSAIIVLEEIGSRFPAVFLR